MSQFARDLQVHGSRAGADPVGDGQGTAPGSRRYLSRKRFEQRLRIAPRDRQYRYFGDRERILDRQASGAGGGAYGGRQWVAGIDRHIHDAAALHTFARPVRAFGKRQALRVAVLVRIGVDQTAHGAVLGGNLGLDAAPGPAVARDHDRAPHRDAPPLQLLVVFRHAEIHINQRARDVAIGGIGVIRGKLLALLRGSGVLGNRRLL